MGKGLFKQNDKAKFRKKKKKVSVKEDGKVTKRPKAPDMKKIMRSLKSTESLDPKKLKKYERGPAVDVENVKLNIHKSKITKKEKAIQFSIEQAARSEYLLTEDSGFLEVDEGEITTQFSQSDLQKAVDPSSAAKRFDLVLNDFGPYRMNYTRNGRFLLLGGRKGHVAAFDWLSKKLLCEMNVMEEIYDIAWLHQETMFAVAQKKWVYFYDNQGIELHCVKSLYDVFKMMFLPYHFLLATVSNSNRISWLDVSIGQMVEQLRIQNHGLVSSVAQNPTNALIGVGQSNGVISFWSPNSKKPVVTKWCHKQPLHSIAFDPRGQIFATAGVDRSLKLWDARTLSGPVEEYRLRCSPQSMAFSHKGNLALAMGNMVEVYKDTFNRAASEKKIYLRHKLAKTISNLEFNPFEDVLGVAHSGGYTSMLVPGSGEPNFDALEINPFQTKSQRKESEVQALLTKIPAELITFDPAELIKVHIPSLEDIIEHKKSLLHIKAPDVQFVPKKKSGKQGGSANAVKRKKIMKDESRKNFYKMVKENTSDLKYEESQQDTTKSIGVLERFRPKPKNK